MSTYFRTRIRDALPRGLQIPAKYWYGWICRALEPEMQIIDRIVEPGAQVIDVGGNRGVYAYKFWRLGCKVELFEPNPVCCEILEAWLCDKDRLNLHRLALSSDCGEAKLHIPVDAAGVEHDASASLERGISGTRILDVPIQTLDSFHYTDVSLIKIDVEGHERHVLAGAALTISNSAPALLIEIEQRHNEEPISRIFNSLEDQGYSGYFLDPRIAKLRSISDFNIDSDQSMAQFGVANSRYINNFLFLHRRRIAGGAYSGLDAFGL